MHFGARQPRTQPIARISHRLRQGLSLFRLQTPRARIELPMNAAVAKAADRQIGSRE